MQLRVTSFGASCSSLSSTTDVGTMSALARPVSPAADRIGPFIKGSLSPSDSRSRPHFSKRLSGAGPPWQRRAKLAPIVDSHVRNLTKSRHGLLWWMVDIAEGPIGPSFDRRPGCRVTRHHGVFQPLPQLRPLSARLPYLDGDRRRLLSDDDDEPLATGSQWPRAFTRRTQKLLSSLWKVTCSTRPARPSQSGHPEYLIVRPTQE